MKYRKTRETTPAQKKFAEVYAKTSNATQATREAYPDTAPKMSPTTLRNKAHRMLTNANVKYEIEAQKQQLAEISAHAVLKLAQHVQSEDETISLNATKFAIEQTHGKATVKVETKSAHVSVIYNLGGASAPAIPEDIQAKINQKQQ